MRVIVGVAGVALLCCCAALPLLADDDRREGEGKKILEAQLVRIADLNVPAGTPMGQQLGGFSIVIGNDPLDEGSVEVRDEGRVEVRLHDAAPNQAYSLWFCRFGFGTPGCVAVGAAGAVATDSDGDGRANLDFPQATAGPNAWAGVFLLSRSVSGVATYQFAGGFRVRPGSPEGAELSIEGVITSINAPGRSFRIGNLPQDIFVDNATEFQGNIRSFSDLAIGGRVEVKARVAADGRVVAREVEMGGEPPRGRGRGRD